MTTDAPRSTWIRLPVATHRAAIAGKLVDAETGRAIEGALVQITAMPATFQQSLAAQALSYGSRWEGLPERPDRTSTAEDGCFTLADLPDGTYTLAFSPPGGAALYGRATRDFVVARAATGPSAPATARIDLPPTAVRGLIQGNVQGTPTPLPMARVRVRDSGERAYGDEDGRFYLTGVELGTRALEITAVGYQALMTNVEVTEGRITEVGPFVLQPAAR